MPSGPKPFYVAGEWRTGQGTLEVRSPYDNALVGTVPMARAEHVREAFEAESTTPADRLPRKGFVRMSSITSAGFDRASPFSVPSSVMPRTNPR